MKKILSVVATLLFALLLVACNKTEDLGGGTYRMALGDAKNLNALTTDQATDSDVIDFLVSNYYSSDYDWATAIEEGYAEKVGDFSIIRNSNELTIDDLGYTRVLTDAAAFPVAVGGDFDGQDATFENDSTRLDVDKSKEITAPTWEVKLRDDLQFEDGTKIDAHTVEYTLKQYLSPTLLAVRGNHVYSDTYLDLVNARDYYYQLTPNEDGEMPEAVDWADVGFEIVDDLTFRMTANTPQSQWTFMSNLTVFNLVHPENFENGYNAEKSRTTYGSLDNIPLSYGPYRLTNWEQDQQFTFVRNETYHDRHRYPIAAIHAPIITQQTTILEEFKAGNLDVAGVSGQFYPEFVDNPGLFITPSSQFMRLDLSIDRTRDGEFPNNAEKESLILKNEKFRQALMVGMDRISFGQGPVAPAAPLVGYVSNIHRAKEEAATYYNSTPQHLELVEELGMSENGGYNPQEAVKLFNEAYQELVDEGLINDGDKVSVEYAYYDVESNQNIANWLKAHFEELFGTDKFEWKNAGRNQDDHRDHLNSGDFDIAFSGLSGGNYLTVELFDMVYASGGFFDGRGWDIYGHEVTNVELFNVFDLIMDTPAAQRSESDLAFLDAVDTNGRFTGTFDELYDLYYGTTRFNAVYEGRDEDLSNMVQAFERVMFELIPSIPLFSSVGATVYSERVTILPPEWSERFGWGGLRYMEVVEDEIGATE